MARKPGSPRQQKIYLYCDAKFRRHYLLVLHVKEEHNVEL